MDMTAVATGLAGRKPAVNLYKLLSFPLKVLWKLIINAILGAVILFLFNLVGGFLNLSIPINALNALITGVLGIPGVILLLILQWIL